MITIRLKMILIGASLLSFVFVALYMLSAQSQDMRKFIFLDIIVESVNSDVSQTSRLVQQYIIHREERFMSQMAISQELLKQHIVQTREMIRSEGLPDLAELATLERTASGLVVLCHKLLTNEKAGKQFMQQGRGDALRQAKELEDILITAIEIKTHDMTIAARRIIYEENRNILQVHQRQKQWLLGITGILGLLIFSMAFTCSRRIISKLNQLREATRKISSERVVRVPVEGRDELDVLCLSFNDMSEKLHASWEAQSRLVAIVESTSDMVVITRPDFQVEYMNRAGLAMIGYAVRELGLLNFAELLTGDGGKPLGALDAASLSGAWTREVELRGKDDRLIPASMVGMEHRALTGEVLNYSFSLRDISERISSEREIVELRNLLRDITNSMPSVLVGVDRENKVIFWNNQAEKLTGISARQATGNLLQALLPGMENEITMVERAISERQVMKKFRMMCKDDIGDRYSDLTVFPLTANGTLGAGLRIDDVTEQVVRDNENEKLLDQLRQTQKLESIGTLAGGIAHDFNNILTSILGYGELVLAELPPGSPLREEQEQILKAGNRARELVKQILTFSRQREQEHSPLYLHVVIKEALKLLRAALSSKIEIRQEIDEDIGAVMGDPTQVHQIIMNLCTNAYHAMREKESGILGVTLKQIEISPSEFNDILQLTPGVYARLEVSDTGCGMSHEIASRIFDPYFTTKKIGEGTGLGLSLVHGIVKDMNGHISVYSEPGKGSTFHVYFPLIVKGVSIDGPAAGEGVLPGGTERLLLVDDEEAIVLMEKKILDSLGYRVTAKTSSLEALQAFREKPDEFDLVITDMNMPKMTGAKLAAEIIAIRRSIPIILCSGFSELINEKKAKAIGIREYVMKPLIRKEFAAVVRKVLDSPVD